MLFFELEICFQCKWFLTTQYGFIHLLSEKLDAIGLNSVIFIIFFLHFNPKSVLTISPQNLPISNELPKQKFSFIVELMIPNKRNHIACKPHINRLKSFIVAITNASDVSIPFSISQIASEFNAFTFGTSNSNTTNLRAFWSF